MITVGIPFYNAEKYLSDAIKSVIAQTYPYWELILIDDGSKDDSLKIAQDFAAIDNRIRVISDGINKRLPARLNQIIKEAKYDYIARMDADDLIHTERLEKQIFFLKSNLQYDLVSTSLLSINNSDNVIGVRAYLPKVVTKKDALMGNSGIVHASILAKKEWCKRNLYNENNGLAEDYELWLNAVLKNDLRVGFLPEYLYYYREEGNVTRVKMLKGYNTQMKIVNKYYENILTEKQYFILMMKFLFKKITVNLADKLNLMHLILKKRNSNIICDSIVNEYMEQYLIIKNLDI
jgi:glycosyltransferase involved in cell wall biosynthesis